jgi:hypothetical protein
MSDLSPTSDYSGSASVALFAALRIDLAKSKKVASYEKIAKVLSRIANKEPAWTWRYVQGFRNGTIRPGKKFMEAVNFVIKNPSCRTRPRSTLSGSPCRGCVLLKEFRARQKIVGTVSPSKS